MIDIETLDTACSTVITQIGGMFFDLTSGESLAEFDAELCVQDQLDQGRTISASTLAWYQNEGLKIAGLDENGTPLKEVLQQLDEWIHANCSDVSALNVWSKGPDFDMAILRDAFRNSSIANPWRFYLQRDLRTEVASAARRGVVIEKRDVSHDALDDCHEQVRQLVECLALPVKPSTHLVSCSQCGCDIRVNSERTCGFSHCSNHSDKGGAADES